MESALKKQILEDIESMQKFIEESDSKNSKGLELNDFDKLCFLQEDLTKLKEVIKNGKMTQKIAFTNNGKKN